MTLWRATGESWPLSSWAKGNALTKTVSAQLLSRAGAGGCNLGEARLHWASLQCHVVSATSATSLLKIPRLPLRKPTVSKWCGVVPLLQYPLMQPSEAPHATSVASLSSDSFLGCSRPKPSDRFHANLGQDRFHAHGPLGVCGRDSTWVNSVFVSSFEEWGGGICSLPFYIPPISVTLLPPFSLSAFREVGAGWPFVVMASVWKVHEEKASPPLPPAHTERSMSS